MIDKPPKSETAFLIIGAASGWFAIIAQFYLIIVNRTVPLAETITRFFGFFTILTNIMVALCFTFLLLKPASSWSRVFKKPAFLTAIASYIIVVGIIYNVILRFLWQPKGLQFIVDEILHLVIPVLFTIYWIMYVSKKAMTWNILPWLVYPLLYCIYTLIRGAIVNYYPYPFIDVTRFGYDKVMINIAGIVILFVVTSLLLVAIAKLIDKGVSNNGNNRAN